MGPQRVGEPVPFDRFFSALCDDRDRGWLDRCQMTLVLALSVLLVRAARNAPPSVRAAPEPANELYQRSLIGQFAFRKDFCSSGVNLQCTPLRPMSMLAYRRPGVHGAYRFFTRDSTALALFAERQIYGGRNSPAIDAEHFSVRRSRAISSWTTIRDRCDPGDVLMRRAKRRHPFE